MKFTTLKTAIKRELISPNAKRFKCLLNCDIKDGRVESRKGFTIDPQNYIYKMSGSEGIDTTFKITNCYMFLNGKYGRIAVSRFDNLSGSISFSMLFLSSDGECISIGNMDFTTNDNDFGYPESYTVFSGKATKGLGVYFMVRRVYSFSEDYVSVRELGIDKKSWVEIPQSDMYAPLILANARGENYYSALHEDKPLELPDPVLPERKNLLGGRFRVAFTTDGESCAYSLPIAQLDDTPVVAELLYEGEKYRFVIPSGDRVSNEVTIGESQMVLYIDRYSGRALFSFKDGAVWAPKYTGVLNNLIIEAQKCDAEAQKKIASMTACSTLEGSQPFGQNPVTLFYGNKLSPSLIALNSQTEPLYFPENLANNLGAAEKPVVYATYKDGKLLAFKAGELYTAELKREVSAQKLNLFGEIADMPISVCTPKKICDFLASPKADTFDNLQGKLMFQAEDNSVWEVTANSAVQKIGEAEKCNFATVQDDKYLLFSGNKATVFQRCEKGYTTYEWSFPQNVIGGFSYLGKMLLYFEFNKDSVYIILPSTYQGDTDSVMLNEHYCAKISVDMVVEADISDTTKATVRLYKILLVGSGKNARLCLYNGAKQVAERRTVFGDSPTKINVGAIGESLTAKLYFNGETTLKGIIIQYKTKC
ncbi:MAG: hypothetical protein IIX54_01635 [Clostridia bacterium]|nr:hypothetical protein [Clostridia bacterium]